MDISSPLRAEVLRPLLTWLVPGAVAITPYLLLGGVEYEGARALLTQFPFIAALACFFAALAAGVVLENLGAAIEFEVWDRLLEYETGWHLAIWHEYLKLNLVPEPVAQRYLRTVLMRLKFELSFSLGLIAAWLGWLLLDDRVGLLSANGQVVFSTAILTVAAYLIWESGRSAKILANTRALIVTGTHPPVLRVETEPGKAAKAFDVAVVVLTIVALVGALSALAWRLYTDRGFALGAGYSAIAVWTCLGAALAMQPSESFVGRRREASLRLVLLCALAFTFISIRLLTTEFAIVNAVGALGLVAAAVFFRVLASCFPVEPRTPLFEPGLDVKESARLAKINARILASL